MTKAPKFGKKTMIAAGVTAVLVLAAGGAELYLNLTGDDSASPIADSDLTTAKREDIVSSVSASGSIEPVREVAITTRLGGPVTELNAKAGDRVNQQQLLAHIDTSDKEEELATQGASQAVEHSQSLNQIQTAQQQLNQFQETINTGLNPEINSAEASARQARAEYDDAQSRLDLDLKAREKGTTTEIREAAEAVRIAREGVATASAAALQSAFASLTAAGSGEPGNIGAAIMQQSQSDKDLDSAQSTLANAEERYAATLETVDHDLANRQREVANKFAALSDADRSVQASHLAADHQQASLSRELDQALSAAATSDAAADKSNEKLQIDMGQADVRSPLNGVITAVTATVGQPSSGPLLTVADDSSLRIKATIREADLASVKEGDQVTFTSPSVKNKSFTGKVGRISPVASGHDEAAKNDSAKPKAEFPVEIEVTGDRDGLRIGSTAKVQIISDKSNSVRVPLTALFEDGGKTKVLVLDNNEIKEREVTVAIRTEFDAGVAGIDSGSRVVTQAEAYRANH